MAFLCITEEETAVVGSVMRVYFLEIFQDSAKKECFCKYDGEIPELY